MSPFGVDATIYDANQRQWRDLQFIEELTHRFKRLVECEREHGDDDGGGLVFLRHAITEQHVTGEYGLTVDTLFGDDGVAAADDDKRARPVRR